MNQFTYQEKSCYRVAELASTDPSKVCKTCGGAGLIAIHNQKVVSIRTKKTDTAVHNCLICSDCEGRGK